MLAEDIISKLQIIPVEQLRTHEEVIPYNLQRLREGMLNMGRLVDPLVVDNKNYVVIDGNHRKKVLELIQCPNAACQLVDYESPEIKLGGWFPISKSIRHDQISGFKPEKVDFEAGKKAIERMEGTFLYMKKNNGKTDCYLYDSNEQTMQGLIASQRKFLSSIEGQVAQYVADDQYEEYLAGDFAVFYRRSYTKKEVIAEAIAGRYMPPKSTRHLIPDRIIRLNLHLGWLSESPETAKQMMDNSLRKRLTESSIRRYVEPVIVLYP